MEQTAALVISVLSLAVAIASAFYARGQRDAARNATAADTLLRLDEQLSQQRNLRRSVHETAEQHIGKPISQWQLTDEAEAADVATRLNVLGRLVEAGYVNEADVMELLSGTIDAMWSLLGNSVTQERAHRQESDYLQCFERLAAKAADHRQRRGLPRRWAGKSEGP